MPCFVFVFVFKNKEHQHHWTSHNLLSFMFSMYSGHELPWNNHTLFSGTLLTYSYHLNNPSSSGLFVTFLKHIKTHIASVCSRARDGFTGMVGNTPNVSKAVDHFVPWGVFPQPAGMLWDSPRRNDGRRQQGHSLAAGECSISFSSLPPQLGSCRLPRRAVHLCAACDNCVSSGGPTTPQSHLENQRSARELANLDKNQIKQLA